MWVFTPSGLEAMEIGGMSSLTNVLLIGLRALQPVRCQLKKGKAKAHPEIPPAAQFPKGPAEVVLGWQEKIYATSSDVDPRNVPKHNYYFVHITHRIKPDPTNFPPLPNPQGKGQLAIN